MTVSYGTARSKIRTNGDTDGKSEDQCCFGVEHLYRYEIDSGDQLAECG